MHGITALLLVTIDDHGAASCRAALDWSSSVRSTPFALGGSGVQAAYGRGVLIGARINRDVDP